MFVIERTVSLKWDPCAPYSEWWTGRGWSEERPNAKEFDGFKSASAELVKAEKSGVSLGNAAIVDEED